MSTLPRPTGKELVRALERAGFVAERVRGSHYFLRHPDKILSDCGIKPEQLSDLL